MFFNFIIICASILNTLAETKIERSLFPPLPIAVLNSDNSLCKKESDFYIQNLENLTLWASEMWDATAKSSTGVLRGSVFQMGHFDQCLTVEAPFFTQYCLARLVANISKPKRHRDPISLYHNPNEHVLERLYPYEDASQQGRNVIQMGWCVPASCSPQDLETFLNSYINELDIPLSNHNVTFQAQVPSISCHSKLDDTQINSADISFCSLTIILIAGVILSTAYEWSINEDKNEKAQKKPILYRLFLSFSAKKNFKDLTRKDESNGALDILYGMKTICIFCIIVDHRFGTFTSSALLNFDYVETQYRAPFAPFIFHGDLFVDTFFVLGGLLVTYGLLNQFDKKKINPGFIILLRYIRLTPVYAFVIFYYATIFNYTGSGPLWKIVAGQDSQDCKDNWWTNILYISNYVNADHMCIVQSWYLPCDFHYFIIAIGLCMLIKKEKKAGLGALGVLTLMSIIIPFVLTWVYYRPALLYFYPEFLTNPKQHPDFLLTYIKSHTRATPYCIGMVAGYIYYKLQGKEVHICRIKSHGILVTSIFFIIISIVGGAAFYDPYHKYNPIESGMYASLHRTAFAIGTFGIIYICSYGHAQFIQKILTWSPWIPLSKLVYGAYLMHMQFQLRAAAKFMNPRQFNYFDVISLGISDIVLAFISALILYLLVEAPFRKIFRELLMPNQQVSPPREIIASPTENVNIMGGTRL